MMRFAKAIKSKEESEDKMRPVLVEVVFSVAQYASMFSDKTERCVFEQSNDVQKVASGYLINSLKTD